jgi:hypothetical protein
MRLAGFGVVALVLILVTACETVSPPEPISESELLELSRGGPGTPDLTEALESRPIGFTLTYGLLRDLESKGVAPETLDKVIRNTTEFRAIEVATAYGYWWYPYNGPWPYYWRVGGVYQPWYWR